MDSEEKLSFATGIYLASKDRVKNTPVPEGQKFLPGTLVRLRDPRDSATKLDSLQNFLNWQRAKDPDEGKIAVVLHTYAHAFGGDDVRTYCVEIEGVESAWFDENWLEAV